MKSEDTKERIILQTIRLIEKEDGKVEQVTIRKIAESASVGVGLINHYFGTKDNLIEVCVQRIIEKVVYGSKSISIEENTNTSKKDEMKQTVKYVMNFLFSHPEISYISILGDFRNPGLQDNSCGTMNGFARRLGGVNMGEDERRITFEIVALIQMAFMKKEIMKEQCGVNLDNQIERDQYIEHVVDMVMKK